MRARSPGGRGMRLPRTEEGGREGTISQEGTVTMGKVASEAGNATIIGPTSSGKLQTQDRRDQ